MTNHESEVLEKEDEKKHLPHPDGDNPKKRFLCIDGKEIPWNKATITTEEIIQVGGWEPEQGVIEVDKDQNERTLSAGEIIEIKPGHGFAKHICWKRG